MNCIETFDLVNKFSASETVAKFLVIVVMLVEVFVLFNVAMYLSAIVPAMLFSNLPYPTAPIPYGYFLNANFDFFLDCRSILALQYLINLQFKNFLVPVGAGFIIWFTGIGMLAWGYSYVLPYNHAAIDYLIGSAQCNNRRVPPINIQFLAVIYFTAITIASYILYRAKKEKG